MQKLDEVQRGSIRRSEAYLRKKAMTKPVSYAREFTAGVLFGTTMLILAVIVLSL
jgi:hypothetical protein